MGNQGWPTQSSGPSALGTASNAGISLTYIQVVRDFVDHPDIAEYVFDVCHPGFERQEPDEARHVENLGGKALSLDKVGQRLTSRGPLARHRVSRFRYFSDVPSRNNFVNRLRGGLHNCSETTPLPLRVAEKIV